MNLILDIGNSRTKIAFYHRNRLFQQAILNSTSLDAIVDGVTTLHIKAKRGIVCSTSTPAEQVVEALQGFCPCIALTHKTPLPIQNQYHSPQTLGKDRLAGVLGARCLYPKSAVLVIDAGTCVTYDALDVDNIYRGGNISPGLRMRLKAMHHFTAKLPLVEVPHLEQPIDLIGVDTATALQRGAAIGLAAETQGMIQLYQQQFANRHLKVIFTGGDGLFLQQQAGLKRAEYHPNIVLVGLNHILRNKTVGSII